jgi:ArsR family transcriptional regulator
MTVTDIQKEIGITKSHTSLMLNFMRVKNVLRARKEGTNVYYSIADDKIAHACAAMQEALAGITGKTTKDGIR